MGTDFGGLEAFRMAVPAIQIHLLGVGAMVERDHVSSACLGVNLEVFSEHRACVLCLLCWPLRTDPQLSMDMFADMHCRPTCQKWLPRIHTLDMVFGTHLGRVHGTVRTHVVKLAE